MRRLSGCFLLFLSITIHAQNLDIYGPQPFSEILSNDFTQSWTPQSISGVENLKYLILMDASTQLNVVNLNASDISQVDIVDVVNVNEGPATYSSLLRSMFQIVDINSNSTEALSGQYTIQPVLHSYYSLNTSDGTTVISTDAGSYYVSDATNAGYLVYEFAGTASAATISAVAQYAFNSATGEFELNNSWTTKWLMISGTSLALTSNMGDASEFMLADPLDLIDFSLLAGSDFNPKGTEWQDNTFASYPDEVWKYEESALLGDQFLMDVDEEYQTQFGNDAAANTAASAALDQIESDLSADGESLRYDKSVYLTFRENMLSRTFGATDMYNAVLGENTVSYVYFTNAIDDDGVRHPFMVIASHDASDGPNFLIDVARPPGDGNGAGYEEQSVTRNAILEVKLVKIPLKDYGLIDNLTDNDLSADGTLAEDVGLTSADFDVYNYAARASNGIAIDGVVIYPAYNNNLRFASMDAEITSTGIHVGRGMGLHYHADGHGFNGNGINLYNYRDYDGNNHPPMIGFGYDGIALFGKYEANYSSMEGYDISLDEYGGHDHSSFGYHYHAFGEVVTVEDEMEGTIGPFTQHFLLVGAWKGNINEIPGIFEGSAAQLKDADVGRFAGAPYEITETPVLGLDEGIRVIVYPNPNDGEFKVIAPDIEKLELHDVAGKLIEVRLQRNHETYIFSGLKSGIYILKGEGTTTSFEKRVVIE